MLTYPHIQSIEGIAKIVEIQWLNLKMKAHKIEYKSSNQHSPTY